MTPLGAAVLLLLTAFSALGLMVLWHTGARDRAPWWVRWAMPADRRA